MKKISFIVRQGDVCLERISKLPNNLTPIKRADSKVVLALGEATGHHHRITSDSVTHLAAPDSDVTYIDVKNAMALLEHEEHAPIHLPPGHYRVRIQREYHPTEIRRVVD